MRERRDIGRVHPVVSGVGSLEDVAYVVYTGIIYWSSEPVNGMQSPDIDLLGVRSDTNHLASRYRYRYSGSYLYKTERQPPHEPEALKDVGISGRI